MDHPKNSLAERQDPGACHGQGVPRPTQSCQVHRRCSSPCDMYNSVALRLGLVLPQVHNASKMYCSHIFLVV